MPRAITRPASAATAAERNARRMVLGHVLPAALEKARKHRGVDSDDRGRRKIDDAIGERIEAVLPVQPVVAEHGLVDVVIGILGGPCKGKAQPLKHSSPYEPQVRPIMGPISLLDPDQRAHRGRSPEAMRKPSDHWTAVAWCSAASMINSTSRRPRVDREARASRCTASSQMSGRPMPASVRYLAEETIGDRQYRRRSDGFGCE